MPRDTVSFVEAVPNLATPSLAGLAWLLRHKEAWPEGFEWYYGRCTSCAMGMAVRMYRPEATEEQLNLWLNLWSHAGSVTRLVRQIIPEAAKMKLREFEEIFWG